MIVCKPQATLRRVMYVAFIYKKKGIVLQYLENVSNDL